MGEAQYILISKAINTWCNIIVKWIIRPFYGQLCVYNGDYRSKLHLKLSEKKVYVCPKIKMNESNQIVIGRIQGCHYFLKDIEMDKMRNGTLP